MTTGSTAQICRGGLGLIPAPPFRLSVGAVDGDSLSAQSPARPLTRAPARPRVQVAGEQNGARCC